MPKWIKGKLNLGRIGKLHVLYDDDSCCRGWFFEWDAAKRYTSIVTGAASFSTEEAAQRAAVRWLRASLQKAARAIGMRVAP
jgi:hypothetical protein